MQVNTQDNARIKLKIFFISVPVCLSFAVGKDRARYQFSDNYTIIIILYIFCLKKSRSIFSKASSDMPKFAEQNY